MKARDIVGKTVARVEQRRVWDDTTGCVRVDVERIVFTDGTWVYPMVHETSSEYLVAIDKGNGRLPV